jgi:glycosyltransferase involved in cell wall biosynthesis
MSIAVPTEATKPAPARHRARPRLRVMQVTDNLGAGGLEQVVVTLCRAMDRTRFEPSVLCLSFIGPLAEKLANFGIPVFQIPVHRKPNYLAFADVARILRAERIDVVHTHNTGPFIDGGVGALLAGVPTIVHTEHGRVFPDKRRYMIVERLLSHRAHKIVGVSDKTVSDLHRYERIPSRKLEQIANGIELDAYSCTIDRAEKRRELGLPANGPIVGLTARLDEPKGLTYLLKALPRLCERFPTLSVAIAGTGNLRDSLEAEARQLGVADRVWFLGLRMDVPELLQLFDVYVLPSISEGLPMALIEAMAAGCATVATDVGGVGTLVRTDETGLLVRSRDPDALCDAVTRMLADEAFRNRASEAGRRAVHEHFSAAAMTRRYERLYLRQGGSPW